VTASFGRKRIELSWVWTRSVSAGAAVSGVRTGGWGGGPGGAGLCGVPTVCPLTTSETCAYPSGLSVNPTWAPRAGISEAAKALGVGGGVRRLTTAAPEEAEKRTRRVPAGNAVR